MWKEALLGCSAICGIGALAAFPNHAIAQSATIVRTGSVYTDIVPAIAAAIQGDTINVSPGTLWMEGTLHTGVTEPTAPFVETDILFKCTGSIGAGPGPSGGCVISGDNVNVYPTKSQLIGKGLVNIGQSGEYPHVTFDGFAFMNAAAGVCLTTLCTDSNFLTGKTAVLNQAWQFKGGNAAGIRYQAGDLTVKNSYFADDDDGILADPFIQGNGTVIVSNSLFERDGATGQEHNMYISRVLKFTIDGSTSQESYNGQDLKCRAVICQVGLTTGNTFGSHSTLDFTGQQLQFPDGGQVDVRNNLIIKGPNSAANANGNGNPWPVAYGGAVMPWATPTTPGHFNFIGNTVLTDPPGAGNHNNDYITNLTPNVGQHNLGGGTYDVQITGNTFAGTAPLPAVLDGLGNQTGNINSLGSAWPATLNILNAGLPVDAGGSWGTIINDSTVAGPVNLTLTTNPLSELVLGGSGALTVNTSSCAGCGIIFGSGGGTVWANPTTGASPSFSVADAVDGSSGPVFIHMISPINAQIFGDNATLVTDKGGSGFLEIGGRNVINNGCPGLTSGAAAPNCGTVVEIKHGIGSVIPSVTMNGQGGRESTFILQSGTGIFNGSVQFMDDWGNSDSGSSNGPSVSIFNRTFTPATSSTWTQFVLSGTVSGDAYRISGPTGAGNFTHGGMASFTDSTHHNIWYPGAGPWEIAMARDTVILGSSTAIAIGNGNASMCQFYPGVQGAFVPGSGNASASMGCTPSVIEVINGQGTGTLAISAYKANPWPVTFLGFSATPGNTPTINGANESVAIVGGPTLVFSAFTGAMNTALPAGAGSLTLAMGATQTIASNTTAALTGMAATDTWAAGFAGVMDLQLKPVNGRIISTGTTIAGGTTGTILNTFAMVNSFLAGASFIAAGANGSVVATLWDQAGVKATGTKSIIVSGASANDMTLNLINGPFTILPGGSVVADVDLEDQFASGTAGTLNASIALQTNGAVIFHGITHASTTGTSFTTFTVGESFAAMQTDLANMTYIGVADPGVSDVISVSVTNQGAFSQSLSVPITSLVQADMVLTVPATSTISANSQDGVGVLVNINDAYAQGNLQSGFIFTANTDSGTLYLNGIAKPSGIVLNDTFQGVNASIDQITYLGTQASTGTISWGATNQGGFSQSGSTVETVLAQGTTNDTTMAFPVQITISAGGSIAIGGVSVTDLYASTAAGPVTLLASDTTGTLTFNGATFGPGQTGTLIDTLPNINADISSLGYIAAGTTNCDGIVLKFTNQGPFTTTKTISATVTASPFSVTGPAFETIATNGTVAVPITLTDGSGVVGNDRAVITTTTGTIVISGQVHSPPVNVTLTGPAANLRTFLAGMQYIAAAGPGSDSIGVSATNAAGAQTSQVTIPVTVTTGAVPPGACPLPP